jgi:hypothetical protein
MKQDRLSVRIISSAVIGLAYILTLITQLPHIYEVYNALEHENLTIFGVSTAWGAAIAFELSVALLTWRLISNKAQYRSPWTRPGIAGFLIISMVANISYYFDIQVLDRWVMPGLLAIALPLALWLYSEEFSSEAGKLVRKASTVKVMDVVPDVPLLATNLGLKDHACWCEWVPDSAENMQQQAAGHKGGHTKEIKNKKWATALDAYNNLRKKYPRAYANGSEPITLQEVAIMREESEHGND